MPETIHRRLDSNLHRTHRSLNQSPTVYAMILEPAMASEGSHPPKDWHSPLSLHPRIERQETSESGERMPRLGSFSSPSILPMAAEGGLWVSEACHHPPRRNPVVSTMDFVKGFQTQVEHCLVTWPAYSARPVALDSRVRHLERRAPSQCRPRGVRTGR
jgi:hypothetical protein